MRLSQLLNEYEQNKVRANTRFRYQENGKIPVSTSGYVSHVEELYVIVHPDQDEYLTQELYCYYADIRVAFNITKGQHVSVTGRIIGTDGYSSGVRMFACEFEGIRYEKNPSVSAQDLRQNVVRVYCTQGSVFGYKYQGTGVITDAKEGTILTVHHVVSDENECDKIEVEIPGIGNLIPAEVIRHCASIDRARLRISPEILANLSLQPVYRAAAPAQTDQEIYFWGYGPGELRMETGIVKDVWDEEIITDAYAVPGDSGSPVFDEYGHLLGTMSKSNRSDRALFTGNEC
jgi:S1-C subfamily serine protease